MYCPRCGKQISLESNFCSNCGAAIFRQPQPMRQTRMARPRHPRMIAGVCAGFAQHFGWDLTVVRVLTVVFTVITSGVGLLVYAAAWVLMPDAPYALMPGAGQPAGAPSPGAGPVPPTQGTAA
jgi:phage shock protein PspC (stress-responsive transcriptional regulator)